MSEVQKHGFSWEKDLIRNVYGATEKELASIKYNSKMDLPAALNHKEAINVSIKTTCSPNSICMADCLRVYDEVSSEKPIHLTVVTYKQNDETKTKKLTNITEVDLTDSVKQLFGTITRDQLEELVKAVKAVPQKRSPTPEEYKNMYEIRDKLQPLSGAIHLDIKCNSQQSRLQCSFNHFQTFLKDHPSRIVAQSATGEFRGGKITEEINSSRRVFKTKAKLVVTTVAPEADTTISVPKTTPKKKKPTP